MKIVPIRPLSRTLSLNDFSEALSLRGKPTRAQHQKSSLRTGTGFEVIAVNKNTGRVEWKVDRPEVISGYSTPILDKPKDGPLEVIVPEWFRPAAYSVKTGDRVWYVRGLACEMVSKHRLRTALIIQKSRTRQWGVHPIV